MFKVPVNEMLAVAGLAATAILPESSAETAGRRYSLPPLLRIPTAKKIIRNLKFFLPHIRLI
jgi:hypothetical protein